MAGSFSDFWEVEILDHLFGKGVYNPPTIYLALHTADPTDDDSGAAEPDDVTGGYARVTTAAADWDAAAAGATANAEILAFVESTAAWSTGATPLTHFGLYDALASGAGNLLAHGDLTSSRIVNAAGVLLRFPVGDLDVTLD